MGYYRRWKKPQHKSFSKDKKVHREEISSLIDNFLKDGKEFTKPRHIIYEESQFTDRHYPIFLKELKRIR